MIFILPGTGEAGGILEPGHSAIWHAMFSIPYTDRLSLVIRIRFAAALHRSIQNQLPKLKQLSLHSLHATICRGLPCLLLKCTGMTADCFQIFLTSFRRER